MTLKALSIALVIAVSTGGLAGPVRADDSAPAYTMEDVKACSKDALRLCRDKLADLGAIEVCMKTKFEQLSPNCQSRFHRDN